MIYNVHFIDNVMIKDGTLPYQQSSESLVFLQDQAAQENKVREDIPSCEKGFERLVCGVDLIVIMMMMMVMMTTTSTIMMKKLANMFHGIS